MFLMTSLMSYTDLTAQGHSLTIDDFELITVIGRGSFGRVRPSITLVMPS